MIGCFAVMFFVICNSSEGQLNHLKVKLFVFELVEDL